MQFHLLSHLTDFRGLSWRSGLFPFWLRSLSPAVWLLWYGNTVFGVWLASVPW